MSLENAGGVDVEGIITYMLSESLPEQEKPSFLNEMRRRPPTRGHEERQSARETDRDPLRR